MRQTALWVPPQKLHRGLMDVALHMALHLLISTINKRKGVIKKPKYLFFRTIFQSLSAKERGFRENTVSYTGCNLHIKKN